MGKLKINYELRNQLFEQHIMRIYLDTCVFQDLKNEESENLLNVIIKSKGDCIYCFSEAHIQDLSRDKTNEKFSDMSFMETIVDDNCFFYEKKFLVSHYTPLDYYNRFDWTTISSANEAIRDFAENDDIFGGLLKSLFSVIPLDFQDLIQQNQLPEDMPQGIKSILFRELLVLKIMPMNKKYILCI